MTWWLGILLVVASLLFIIISVKSVERGLWLIALLLPTYLVRFTVVNIPMTFLELMILLLFAVWGVAQLRNKTPLKAVLSRKEVIAIIVLIAAAAIGLRTTPDTTAGLGIFKAYIIEPILLYIVTRNTLTTTKQLWSLATALFLSAAVVSAIAVIQYGTGWGIPEPWQALAGRRAVSLYGFPNAVGLFVAPILTLAIAQLIHGWSTLAKERRMFLIGISILLTCALVAARVDGAVIAVAAATFFLLLFTRIRWWAVGGAAISAIGLFAFEPTRRLLLFQDVSGDVRLALWTGTWNLLSHLPLTGAGLAGFPSVYNEYRLDSHVELLQYPHNILFNFWSELGLLGALWIVSILGTVVVLLLRARRTQQLWSLALLAVFISVVVYGLVDVPVFKNDLSALFALWLAMTATIVTNTNRTQKRSTNASK